MKFPSMEEMAKEVAEKALDEYEYQGKTIRQWVEILKDYDDKRATLQRIVERMEELLHPEKECFDFEDDYIYAEGRHNKYIEIVKEEGLN